jgi:hypothetical protein
VRQKRSAPGGFGISDATAHHLSGQATHRPASQIQQPGLSRQGLSVLRYAHHVASALPQTTRLKYVHDGVVAVQVVNVLAQPPGDDAEVDLRLDDHPTRDDVQAAREPQQGRHFGATSAYRVDHQTRELVLDLGCHRHESPPLGP